MKYKLITLTALALLSATASAKEPKIASDNSGIGDAKLINNAAAAAIGAGAKEPLHISKSGDKLIISGSDATKCTVPVAGDPPKMQGISCK